METTGINYVLETTGIWKPLELITFSKPLEFQTTGIWKPLELYVLETTGISNHWYLETTEINYVLETTGISLEIENYWNQCCVLDTTGIAKPLDFLELNCTIRSRSRKGLHTPERQRGKSYHTLFFETKISDKIMKIKTLSKSAGFRSCFS